MRLTPLFATIILALALACQAHAASVSIPDTAHALAMELDAQLAEKLGAESPVKGVTMIVTTPTDLDDMEKAVPVARLISEEMTGWFVNAGYRVSEMRTGRHVLMKPGTGEMLLTRRADLLANKFRESQLILVGTYTGTAKYIRFNMRLIQAATGEVVSMSSKTLAISVDTAELAGEERYAAFSRVRPSVSTKLPSVDRGHFEKAKSSLANMFGGLTGQSEQHPVYAPGAY